jgi:hypothetical protein
MEGKDQMKIKAIVLKSPWAEMVASGRKTIETRTWPTKYRGPLLIIASMNPKVEVSGKAIAITFVDDCRVMVKGDESRACCPIYPGAHSWFLSRTKKLASPFNVKGQLRLFDVDVPDDIDLGDLSNDIATRVAYAFAEMELNVLD